MSIPRQLLVAAVAAATGLVALGVFWLVMVAVADTSDLGYREVAVGTLAYATVYVLTVPRAERWVRGAEGGPEGTTA